MIFVPSLFLATNEAPMKLYKIISLEQWHTSKALDHIALDMMDNDFIHFATEEQVDRVAAKFWANKAYLVLTLNTELLPGTLVHEANRPGGDKYYHLYNGSIPKAAIIDYIPSQP